MKIIINATNTIEDRPLREVERLINLGKAHIVKEEVENIYRPIIQTPDDAKEFVRTIMEYNTDLIPLHNDQILNSKQQETLKKFIEEKKKEDVPKITFEDLDDITEIDVIEPIPIDHYVDFESPKKMSLLKKLRNKII